MSDTVINEIKQQIKDNPVIVYIKGSPEMPQCGFSMKVCQALMACGEEFAYVDVLSNPEVRQTLPQVADWPTFPQLFVAGELVGGCDIVCEMHEAGELEPLIKGAVGPQDAS